MIFRRGPSKWNVVLSNVILHHCHLARLIIFSAWRIRSYQFGMFAYIHLFGADLLLVIASSLLRYLISPSLPSPLYLIRARVLKLRAINGFII